MNRRTFLRHTLAGCVSLWLGQNIFAGQQGWAKTLEAPNPSAHAIIKSIKKSKKKNNDGEDYFRLIVELSTKCEFTTTYEAEYIEVTLENCEAGRYEKRVTVKNEFVSEYRVEDDDTDTKIKIRIKVTNRDESTKVRAFMLAPNRTIRNYRLMIDVGYLPNEGGDEGNLAVWETYLNFIGQLDRRDATKFIVVHHVGNTNEDVSAREIHQWHLQNGWCGIGYHYVIRKDGRIERGRPQKMVGAHAYHYNQDSIGICVVGEFEQNEPQPEQIDALTQLLSVLCDKYHLHVSEKTILGHRDLNVTLCPGQNLYSQLPEIRQNVIRHMIKNI